MDGNHVGLSRALDLFSVGKSPLNHERHLGKPSLNHPEAFLLGWPHFGIATPAAPGSVAGGKIGAFHRPVFARVELSRESTLLERRVGYEGMNP